MKGEPEVMKKAITFFIAFFMSSTAFAWDVADMNKTIDQTNFVINRGCSGTLISLTEKLILTNYHCIDQNVSVVEKEETDSNGLVKKVRRKRYSDVVVEQHGYNGFARVSTATYMAEIVAEEKKKDLALIRIKSTTIPHQMYSRLLPDDQKISRGERVYVVGNPAGNDATVVEGIVSNLNRTFEFPWTGNEKLAMIQFSGGIYGGNSGGALYNSNGYLIGVPAAGFRDATFIGLAIPVSVVKTFLKDNCMANIYDDKFDVKACKEAKAKKEKKE